MKSYNHEVSLQANARDEEVDLSSEEMEAREAGRPPTRSSGHNARGPLKYLVPILLHKLTKEEEIDDEDGWNPSKAAEFGLMVLATSCEDEIVPHVLPFIEQNMISENWRFRDAALKAFGSILGGLEPNTLKPLVERAMPTMIQLMYDNNVIVRDTAAWTFGRICEIIPEAVLDETYLKPLLKSLVKGLKAEARVAANVCWVFTGLAKASYEAVEGVDEPAQPQTYCLSQYFEFIVQKLLETTDRPDGVQNNLTSAAYEALLEMVKDSPKVCYKTVRKITLIILQRLQQILLTESYISTENARSQFNDLQCLLCVTLQSVMRKINLKDDYQISDAIMSALLSMLSSNSCSEVQQGALNAIVTLVNVLQEGFWIYMDALKPYLCIGLKNHQEYQVCGAAVGLTGHIWRVLKIKDQPYYDEIMTILLENLSTIHHSVKPLILSVFGDIASSVGPEFKKYLGVLLQMAAQVSQAKVDRTDFDMTNYLNELREGILEAYIGIVQGLKGQGPTPNPDIMLIKSHVQYIIYFITVVSQDPDVTETNVALASGLVGDLCEAFGAPIAPLLDLEAFRAPIMELLTIGRRSRDNKTKNLAEWATSKIRILKFSDVAS